jgi:ATP-dependent DNA ligase
MVAFDLIELQGDDLRKEPLFNRKQRLVQLLGPGPQAIVYNEHITHDGPTLSTPAALASRASFLSGWTSLIAAVRPRPG